MKNYYQPLNIKDNTISGVSNKTLENSSINIIDVNKYVDPSTVSLKVNDHCIGKETKVIPYLKAGTESFEFINSTDSYSTIYIYVVINGTDGPNPEFLILDDDDVEVVSQPAIIRYNITSGTPDGSPTVIDAGKFLPKDIPYTSNVLSRVTALNIASGSEGNAYKLGSTFEIEDQPWDIDDTPNTLTISCTLKADEYTLSVAGGSGYQVGDTFTLTDGAVTAVYEVEDLTIEEVVPGVDIGYKDGTGVATVKLVSSDSGFTNTPTVTYNGSTGSGATITVNDDYAIGSVSIVNASNMGYINGGTLRIMPKDISDEEYFPDHAIVTLSTEAGDDSVTFTDKLLLHSFEVVETGNNVRDDSILVLEDSSGVLENVVEITSTIDASDTDNLNRTTYKFSPQISN